MKMKLSKKQAHIILIMIGMIFTVIPLFHTNIWFDESYSIALASHSFGEIWSIDIHDVHPVFYYDCLHALYLMFGTNILVYRLFSWCCLSLMGIFGYTGIRRDYGEDCGLWFTFLIFFLPINIVYAGEIRMYMLVALLLLVGTFFAIRIAKGSQKITDHVAMALCFILVAYTHYYGLLAVAIVNFLLLLVLAFRHKERTWKDLIFWLVDAVLQIGCYLPWIFVFIAQTNAVKTNFWIKWYWPRTYIEFVLFQVSGNLEHEYFIPTIAAALLEAALLVYLLYNTWHKKHQHGEQTLFPVVTYFGVILIAWLAGKVMNRTIIYARYLLVCTPLLLFYIAYNFATFGKKILNAVFCISIVICAVIANLNLDKIDYDPVNQDPYIYLNEHMQPGDAILVSNYKQDPNSFIAVSQYMDHPLYYWNEQSWMHESVLAYQAYGTQMNVVYDLQRDMKDFKGRVWVIYADDDSNGKAVNHVYDAVICLLQGTGDGTVYFKTNYKRIEYTIGLVTV
jgi:uncharacterized membrane protein